MIKNIKEIFKKYFSIEEITIEHEGKQFTRERLNKESAVAAIVFNTETNNFLFVKQFRAGCLMDLIEIVAGTLKENEDPTDCISREIEEELGYEVDYGTILHENFYMSPGYTNEKMTLFYCEVSKKINDGGGLEEENENISIIEMTEDIMLSRFKSGFFKDSKTLISILTWLNMKMMLPFNKNFVV